MGRGRRALPGGRSQDPARPAGAAVPLGVEAEGWLQDDGRRRCPARDDDHDPAPWIASLHLRQWSGSGAARPRVPRRLRDPNARADRSRRRRPLPGHDPQWIDAFRDECRRRNVLGHPAVGRGGRRSVPVAVERPDAVGVDLQLARQGAAGEVVVHHDERRSEPLESQGLRRRPRLAVVERGRRSRSVAVDRLGLPG